MKELQWYVLQYNFNKKKVEYYNIFNHTYIYDSIEMLLKNFTSYDIFVEQLDKLFRYCFWAKRECEISVGDAFETDIYKLEKIDIYSQLKPNLELIAKYIIHENETMITIM